MKSINWTWLLIGLALGFFVVPMLAAKVGVAKGAKKSA